MPAAAIFWGLGSPGLYCERKFAEARVRFDQVLEKNPEDKAALIYLKRCASCMVQGVPAGWTWGPGLVPEPK